MRAEFPLNNQENQGTLGPGQSLFALLRGGRHDYVGYIVRNSKEFLSLKIQTQQT